MSISKAFVELMGGTIQIKSVEGAGSTFSFTLPYKLVNRSVNFSPDTKGLADKSPALCILIAEDDEVSTLLLKKILQDQNSTILFAENGWEAVELVQHHPEIKLWCLWILKCR